MQKVLLRNFLFYHTLPYGGNQFCFHQLPYITQSNYKEKSNKISKQQDK